MKRKGFTKWKWPINGKISGEHWGFLLLLKCLKFGSFCFGFVIFLGKMKNYSFGRCMCVCVCVSELANGTEWPLLGNE